MKKRVVAPALLVVLTLVLSACVQAPVRSVSTGAESAWQARQAALTAVSAWALAGRMAAHNGAAMEGAIGGEAISVNATLHWAQQADDYSIDVIAPFGQAMQLEGRDGGVVARLPDGRQISAANPDALLYESTGLRLPMSSLRFWVRGLPAPMSVVHKALDDTGRPLWLEQSGWRVEFLRYTQINGLDLPDKLVITQPPLLLRLVIDRWDL